jgi:NAD(P)-dependent dehydrogenase (short-subunit alcohol dehydrogenase family)
MANGTCSICDPYVVQNLRDENARLREVVEASERERDQISVAKAELFEMWVGAEKRSDVADIVAWLRKDDNRAAPYWTRTALADAIEKGKWKQK